MYYKIGKDFIPNKENVYIWDTKKDTKREFLVKKVSKVPFEASLKGYSSKRSNDFAKKLCDLEVEDNHNFIVNCHHSKKNRSGTIVHNCHLAAAETLAYVNLDITSNAPYRFYVSATQLRHDGKDLLLKAITGPIVLEKNYKELAQGGYLTKLIVKTIDVQTFSSIQKSDPNENTRIHFFYNNEINRRAAELANMFVDNGKPTLILVKEIEQAHYLMPYLKHQFGFAHGGNLNSEQKKKLPKEYHNSDTKDLVNQIKNNTLKLLIGTSAISMGTDIPNIEAIINLRGGCSPIDVRQSIGRGSRNSKGKEGCIIIDFNVINNRICNNHFKQRLAIYKAHTWEVKTLKY